MALRHSYHDEHLESCGNRDLEDPLDASANRIHPLVQECWPRVPAKLEEDLELGPMAENVEVESADRKESRLEEDREEDPVEVQTEV